MNLRDAVADLNDRADIHHAQVTPELFYLALNY